MGLACISSPFLWAMAITKVLEGEVNKMQLSVMGKDIRSNEMGLVSLTDLWKASGGSSTKHPSTWIQNDSTEGFILQICKVNKLVASYR